MCYADSTLSTEKLFLFILSLVADPGFLKIRVHSISQKNKTSVCRCEFPPCLQSKSMNEETTNVESHLLGSPRKPGIIIYK